MTGAQFYAFLSVVAKRLHEKGIALGDVIGVSMDHSPLYCAVLMTADDADHALVLCTPCVSHKACEGRG